MIDFIADRFGIGYTDEHKKEVYEVYLKLSKLPKKDWNKQSTKDKLAESTNVLK